MNHEDERINAQYEKIDDEGIMRVPIWAFVFMILLILISCTWFPVYKHCSKSEAHLRGSEQDKLPVQMVYQPAVHNQGMMQNLPIHIQNQPAPISNMRFQANVNPLPNNEFGTKQGEPQLVSGHQYGAQQVTQIRTGEGVPQPQGM